MVTDQLKREKERPTTPDTKEVFGVELQTPLTVKSLRQFHLDYRKNPTREKTTKLFSSSLQLCATLNISRYAEEGLREAMVLQKRKKRGVKLGLDGKEDKGQAAIWDDEDLRGAIERINTLTAEKQLLQDQQKARKAAATAKKMQLEQEKAEKAAQKALEKEVNNKKKAEEKAAINTRVMARKDGVATKRATKEEAKRLREETAVAKAIAKQAVLNRGSKSSQLW
jgi:hypothetical protein